VAARSQLLGSGALRRTVRRAALAVLLSTGLLAGCGLGAGATPGVVTLTVTREFGARVMPHGHPLKVRGEETVMSLLMRNYKVATHYGGGFVESVNGHSGGHVGGDAVDWFYYVNGVEAPEGAAETKVHRGDAIWWDLHDWSQTFYTPAVVGSYPEPFVHGIGGKRLPVRVECSEPQAAPCSAVAGRMGALGVPAGVAALGPAGEVTETLRLVVGPWSALRRLGAVQSLMSGPRASGVYARISADGSSIALLDARGRTRQTLTAGAGLLAALRPSGEAPLWVITGTDAAGVQRAANALNAATLHNHFAVALPASGAALPLPREG
jgi:hypothetical protein